MNTSVNRGSLWMLLAILSTLIIGTIYLVAHTTLSNPANDTLGEITQEITGALEAGVPAEQIIPQSGGTNLQTSLTSFAALYDKDGKVIGSSAQLDGQSPTPPSSTFQTTTEKNQYNFTWEPKAGLRVAAVMQTAKSGDTTIYVLAGKNLRETEKHLQTITSYCLGAWILLLILCGLIVRMVIPASGVTKDTNNDIEAPATEKTEESI